MSRATMEVDSADTGRERVGLAIVLTLVEVLMFFGFITLAAASPATLASPVVEGSNITLAFLYGIVILVAGVLLIGLYVLIENAADSRDFVSTQPKVIR